MDFRAIYAELVAVVVKTTTVESKHCSVEAIIIMMMVSSLYYH